MTLYLNTLLGFQQDLATLINSKLEDIIYDEEINIIISIVLLAAVLLMCLLIIYSVKTETDNKQKYALILEQKTQDLDLENIRALTLVYQMVPKSVAEEYKNYHEEEDKYFEIATIMSIDIFEFTRITKKCSPAEIVSLLNSLYAAMDEKLDRHDVYKVETSNDFYLVASGLPKYIGNRHSLEIAALACEFIDMMVMEQFSAGSNIIKLKIGINTGPVMTGIVGTIVPRYCLLGNTVQTSTGMQKYGLPNKIQISSSTYTSLMKHGDFVMEDRGLIDVKDKGLMNTYWLIGPSSNMISNASQDNDVSQQEEIEELPGEILSRRYPPFSVILNLLKNNYQYSDSDLFEGANFVTAEEAESADVSTACPGSSKNSLGDKVSMPSKLEDTLQTDTQET